MRVLVGSVHAPAGGLSSVVGGHGLLAALLAAVAGSALGLPARAAAQNTIELPVAFQVKNTNTSQAPCPPGAIASDGATYTIRGDISGPQAALASGKASSITV
jgi:hypothetical protein